MLLKKIEDVLKEHPEYNRGWEVLGANIGDKVIITGIENPRYGKIDLWVNCKDDGTPIYDQPVITEGPADKDGKRPTASAAIIVPYLVKDNSLEVGLIQSYRAVVRSPETGSSGYKSWEVPRGFSRITEVPEKTAIRELGEETSKVAKKIYRLGNEKAGVNANSAFYATHITAWAAEVDPSIESLLKPDSKEPILKCEFKKYKDVREMIAQGQIGCGLSLAGLMLFDTFLEKHYGRRY